MAARRATQDAEGPDRLSDPAVGQREVRRAGDRCHRRLREPLPAWRPQALPRQRRREDRRSGTGPLAAAVRRRRQRHAAATGGITRRRGPGSATPRRSAQPTTDASAASRCTSHRSTPVACSTCAMPAPATSGCGRSSPTGSRTCTSRAAVPERWDCRTSPSTTSTTWISLLTQPYNHHASAHGVTQRFTWRAERCGR